MTLGMTEKSPMNFAPIKKELTKVALSSKVKHPEICAMQKLRMQNFDASGLLNPNFVKYLYTDISTLCMCIEIYR